MDFVFLISGLLLLAISGDALVRGAISAADRMHIPPIITGLTIVAFGTSAPELIVSIEAAMKGAPGLALGNVIGSNVANTLLVLGVPAIIAPIIISEGGMRRSTVFLIAMSFILLALIFDGNVSQFDGLLLFTLLVVYLTYSGIEAMKSRKETLQNGNLKEADDNADKPLTTMWIIGFIGFGIIGLGIGGKLTIAGAIDIAARFNVADTAIGLTIVALGTSLPELAASVSAALRKQAGMMIGNVIGSSIFNILGIVGITAMIIPLAVPKTIISFDIWVMIGVFLLLIPMAYITRKIGRVQGWLMTLAYLAYILMVFRTAS